MQKRLEQLKHIVGHFNNEEATKRMIENEGKSGDKLAIKDLSEEEDDEDEECANQSNQFEQYREEAKANISELSTLLNK